MSPFRFVPLIIIGLVAGEIFQSVIGLLAYEGQDHTVSAVILTIASSVCHLVAFYCGWITVVEIKGAVSAPQENHSQTDQV